MYEEVTDVTDKKQKQYGSLIRLIRIIRSRKTAAQKSACCSNAMRRPLTG